MTFRYRIVKKSVGSSPYTTRPELGVTLTEAEVIQEIEAATSVTGGDVNYPALMRRIQRGLSVALHLLHKTIFENLQAGLQNSPIVRLHVRHLDRHPLTIHKLYYCT